MLVPSFFYSGLRFQVNAESNNLFRDEGDDADLCDMMEDGEKSERYRGQKHAWVKVLTLAGKAC